MNNVHMSNREKAINWWIDVVRYPTTKEMYTDRYFEGRHFTSLTGREIEIIYNLVHKVS